MEKSDLLKVVKKSILERIAEDNINPFGIEEICKNVQTDEYPESPEEMKNAVKNEIYDMVAIGQLREIEKDNKYLVSNMYFFEMQMK